MAKATAHAGAFALSRSFRPCGVGTCYRWTVKRFQTLQEGKLAGHDLPASIGKGKPFGAINLGKRLETSASGWPFDFEWVAAQRGRVEFSFESEGGHMFSALLTQFAQRLQAAFGDMADFLGEFASSGGLGRFILRIFSLGNGPCAFIPFAPKGTTGMNEQHQDIALRPLYIRMPALFFIDDRSCE